MKNIIFFLIIAVIILIFFMNKYQINSPQTETTYDETQNIIDEYLNENECKENFDSIGMSEHHKNSLENITNSSNMNMGNNMNFKKKVNSNPSPLSKALSKSMVPDFEPNSLNINPDLNSYGYATTNPEASEYYKARGFMNPADGSKYADSVSYMLSHPYQTRYCEKQN